MADWLRRYLNPDSGIDREEHVHELDGWEFATDSRCLLATRERSLGISRPAGLLPQSQLHTIRKVLMAYAPEDARVTTLGDLWLWLDRVWRVVCPACAEFRRYHGAPDWREPYWLCSECDWRGWVFPCPEPVDGDTVTVAGHPFDRNRLAWWLPAELGEPWRAVTYWVHFIHSLPCLHLVGESWRLAVMGLKREMHPGVYRSYEPGAGLWWSVRRGGAFAGADWFRERGVEDGRAMWGAAPEPVGV